MSRTILAAVDDMFFASKIRAVAEHLGVKVRFLRSNAGLIEAALNDVPSLIIADLHSQKFQPVELGRQLKEQEQLCSVPLIGFFSHVETALQKAAEAAGYDRVLPRSAFTNQLSAILSGL